MTVTLEQARPGQYYRKEMVPSWRQQRQTGWREETDTLGQDACCLPVVPVVRWWGKRADRGHLVSLPSCALSLSYKHWRVRCFTFTSPSHSRPVSNDAGGKTVFWPGILFKLIPCPQSARPPGMFWLWLNNILCFSIKYCVACWLFAEIKNYSC